MLVEQFYRNLRCSKKTSPWFAVLLSNAKKFRHFKCGLSSNLWPLDIELHKLISENGKSEEWMKKRLVLTAHLKKNFAIPKLLAYFFNAS